MDLLIVESPAKAKTIQKYLGGGYAVRASVGHVIDLPKTKLGVDLDQNFAPDYTVIRGKAKVLKELLAEARKSEQVLLATDLDREGEAIAWHIASHLDKAGKPIRRIVFNEITQTAIKQALAHPADIDRRKVDAQQARRILDRLVGYLVSPQLWTVFYKGLSAGRVQTVALRLICEREAEIEAFQKEEYWTIHARFQTEGAEALDTELAAVAGEKPLLPDGAAAEAIVARARAATYAVHEVQRKERKRSPKPPLITSTLQQDAARQLGFSAKKTMAMAQALYEGVELGAEGPVGLITYMRTDSVRLATEARQQIAALIGERFGAAYAAPEGRTYRSAKKAQDAHEAIRPTSITRAPEEVAPYLSRDHLRLYDLIWRRTVASQMPDARYDQTTVTVLGLPEGAARNEPGAEKTPEALVFRATGSVVTFPGFLAVMPDNSEEDGGRLPAVSEGESLTMATLEPKQHFTQPPPRYRDASLVKELEARGIGRPSTYASIISTLLERNYVDRQDKQFAPTRLGREVWQVLGEALPHLFAVKFTALMEDELDRIEAGELPWQQVVRDFYDPFRAELDEMERGRERLRQAVMPATDIPCPKCGRPLVEKWGSNGKFLACPAYPDCKHSQPLPSDTVLLAEPCPTCGSPLQVRNGRFGPFVACTAYPECKYTRPVTLGIACPREGCTGQLTERRSKRGKTFFGCSRYPDCDFVSWYRPIDRACEACGHAFLTQRYSQAKGRYLVCPACQAETLE